VDYTGQTAGSLKEPVMSQRNNQHLACIIKLYVTTRISKQNKISLREY
jgi:hypothetical protein